MPMPEPAATSLPELRAELVALEAAIPELHAAVARTALASYGDRDNVELRRDADQALASLRDATDRLQQLQAATALAARQEADATEQAAEAERQAAKDRLAAKRERAFAHASAATEKRAAEEAKLPEATVKLNDLSQQWRNQSVVVEVVTQRIADFRRHETDAWQAIETLDAEIADTPVTAAEIAEKEADRVARKKAELEAARLAFERDTAEQLRMVHDNERVEVEPPVKVFPDDHRPNWGFSGGLVSTVPRKDLDFLAEAAHRYEAASAPQSEPEKSVSAEPWKRLMGSPAFLGREAAINCWAKTAPPETIAVTLKIARQREDQVAVDLLSSFNFDRPAASHRQMLSPEQFSAKALEEF